MSRMRFRRIAAVAALGVAALVLSGCSADVAVGDQTSSATPSGLSGLGAATTAAFQQALDDTRAKGDFPGVIAEVISPKGTWIGTSGTAGPDTSAAPTPKDHTRIGSLTKTMTATVLLQLAHEHALSLDDAIGKYVPGMPNGDTATLLQLADMTSGIPSYTADAQWQKQVFSSPQRQWTAQQLIDFEVGKPAEFAPGTGWSYSNTNYVLLGMVIEKVTGKPIAQVFQTRLFDPLGMKDTSFPYRTRVIPSPHLRGITAQGQSEGTTTDATGFSPSIAFTAGEVISTLDDLKKWAHALFTGDGILDPAMQKLRRDSINHTIPPNTATAGYGIGIGDKNGWWGHDGEIPGFTTSLFHNYTLDTTVIVIANSDVAFGPEKKPTTPAPAVFAALVAALN